MYDRDAKVALQETLTNLAGAMDRLMEVVAKDATLKEIADLLKEKSVGGRSSKEAAPTAGERADGLFPKVARRTTTTQDYSNGFDYGGMRRMNTAFRMLENNLGSFGSTLGKAFGWTSKALRSGGVDTAAETVMKSPIKNYKQAEKWFLDKLIAEKGEIGGYQAFRERFKPDINEMMKFAQAGFDPKLIDKIQSRKIKESVLKEAQEATAVPVATGRAAAVRAAMGAPGGGAGGALGTLLGTATAIGAVGWAAKTIGGVAFSGAKMFYNTVTAPIALGEMAKAGAEKTRREISERYGPYSGEIANANAQYLLKSKLLDMEYAPVLAADFKKMTESEARFDRSMKPFYTGVEKIWMNVKTFFMDAASWTNENLFDPLGNIVNPKNNPGKFKGFNAEDMVPGGGILKNVPILGGVGFGVGLWMKQKMVEENPAVKDQKLMATEPGAFALQISRVPIAPPRRFIP